LNNKLKSTKTETLPQLEDKIENEQKDAIKTPKLDNI